MRQDRFTQIAGFVSIILSVLTFTCGDNILDRIPSIQSSAVGTMVKVIGSFFLFAGFFATALYLISRSSAQNGRALDAGKAFYICCVMVTLCGGTLWDAFTTLMGIQNIFQTAAPEAGHVHLLIPTVIATGIIYLCVLIPSAHVFEGTFPLAVKLAFAPLFVLTMMFDLYTSTVGNAHFLLAIDDTTQLIARDFYSSNPNAAITLVVVTIFSTASPIMLSIMFRRLFARASDEVSCPPL